MHNPFRKNPPVIDDLISILFIAIDELSFSIEELKADVADLTDFVEENLD
jgi:hypothetical protein